MGARRWCKEPHVNTRILIALDNLIDRAPQISSTASPSAISPPPPCAHHTHTHPTQISSHQSRWAVPISKLPKYATLNAPLRPLLTHPVRHVHSLPHQHHVLLRHEPGWQIRGARLLAQAGADASHSVRARGDCEGVGAAEGEESGEQEEEGGRGEDEGGDGVGKG